MNIDYELINLLFKNNLSHILDENDNKEYDICGKKVNGELLTIHMKLATITNEEILEYLNNNILKSFNKIEPFMLSVYIANMFPYRVGSYINSFNIILYNKNYKWIEIFVKNFNNKKLKILEELTKNNSKSEIIEILINSEYLSNEFEDFIIDFIIDDNIIIKNDKYIPVYFKKFIKQDYSVKKLESLFSKLLVYENLTLDILENNSDFDIILNESNKRVIITDPKTYIINIILNIKFGCSKNYKIFVDLLINKNYLHHNMQYQLLIHLINHIMEIYNNKRSNYHIFIDVVDYITKKIIKDTPLHNNMSYYCLDFIQQGVHPVIIRKLFGYDIYSKIHSNANIIPELLIKSLVIHNFRRIRRTGAYTTKDSYLYKENNLLSYIDKYYHDPSILLQRYHFDFGNVSIDLITAAVIVGDLDVIKYLLRLHNSNCYISSEKFSTDRDCTCNKIYEEDMELECGSINYRIDLQQELCFDKSEHTLGFIPHYNTFCDKYIYPEGKHHCIYSNLVYKYELSSDDKKISGFSNIISLLINSNIKEIIYHKEHEDNSKLIKHFKL